jgi:glycosyltransferase involved in cell wall biosynthesis
MSHDRTLNRPLRIALDASRTTALRITGTEHYAIRLLQSLIELNETAPYRHHLTLYFRDPPSPALFPPSSLVTHKVLPQRRLWTHTRFARALWADRPDVTFVPAHTLPLIFPGRAVVTVHDLGFKVYPKAHPARQRLYLDLTTRFSAARATVVLADSLATTHDLTDFYGTEADKIRVVYPGVEIEPPEDTSQIEAVHHKYHLPKRYFLFIGTLQPRKNIAQMVQAFAWFRRKSKQDIGFVLAGGQGWLYDPAWTAGVEGVTLTGFIDEADKPALYAGALGLVFVTLYEGFGFPVIEAMRCGTPVIASTLSSLPELVGDAGLLVDPEKIPIADAMGQLATDPQLRQTLRERGYAQAQQFNWSHAAQLALDALGDAAQR